MYMVLLFMYLIYTTYNLETNADTCDFLIQANTRYMGLFLPQNMDYAVYLN